MDEPKTFIYYSPAGPVRTKADHQSSIWLEEGKLLYEEVKKSLETSDEGFLGYVVMALVLDHNAAITGIYADQWFAVAAQSSKFSTYIQCDDPAHGLAATLRAFEGQAGS